MESNLNIIARDLYGKIQNRFSNIKIGDENATVLSKKEDIPKARFFEFEFKDDGSISGTVTITLDKDDGVILQISGDLFNSGSHTAYKFIQGMRQFAKNHLLKFDVQNIGKSNLDKRDYQFQAKRKEMPPVMENKLYGSNKISYQDLGPARLIIKHNQPVNELYPISRTQHINSIYIENAQGERFKYPFKHINGARALGEHVAHGGNPYDSIGKHITSLSEELIHLRKFKNYVGRQSQLSEALGSISTKVFSRIEEVKKELTRLQRPGYYEQFAESFKEPIQEDIPEGIVNDWIDRLTIRSFNEELKSAFPYLYKIIDESDIPIKELSPDDLLSSVTEQSETEQNKLFSVNPAMQQSAAKEFNSIMGDELINGPSGFNSIQTLKGVIDDTRLSNILQKLDGNLDARSVIQAFVLDNISPNIKPFLNFSGTPEQTQEPETTAAPPPAPPAEAPAEAPPSGEMGSEMPPEGNVPPEGEMGGEAPPANATGEVEPGAEGEVEPGIKTPVGEEFGSSHRFSLRPGFSHKSAKRRKLKSLLSKAQRAGATLETTLDFGHKVMSINEAMDEAGLTPMECGFDNQPAVSGVDAMLDFVSGFWNKEDNNFPRGATGVKTILKKKFEDGEFENATEEDIEHVFSVIEKLDPSGNISRIKQLAGLGSHGDSRLPMKKLVMSMQESVIDSMKTFINKINKDQ